MFFFKISGKYCQYFREDLVEVVLNVKTKKMTSTEASQVYGIPRKTQTNHVLGKVNDFHTTGRDRALIDEEESAVVDYLKYMSRHNFPLRRCEVRSLIVVGNDDVISNIFIVISLCVGDINKTCC